MCAACTSSRCFWLTHKKSKRWLISCISWKDCNQAHSEFCWFLESVLCPKTANGCQAELYQSAVILLNLIGQKGFFFYNNVPRTIELCIIVLETNYKITQHKIPYDFSIRNSFNLNYKTETSYNLTTTILFIITIITVLVMVWWILHMKLCVLHLCNVNVHFFTRGNSSW